MSDVSSNDSAQPDLPQPARLWNEQNAHEFLTGPQRAALALLVSGKTIRYCAESAGVHRNTVANWIRRDPVFRAAYNAWRREVCDSARTRVLCMAEAAARVVAEAIHCSDAKIALAVLRDLGLTRPESGSRPTHPFHVHEQLIEAAEKRDQAILRQRSGRTIARAPIDTLRQEMILPAPRCTEPCTPPPDDRPPHPAAQPAQPTVVDIT
jgi:hypothetical protein